MDLPASTRDARAHGGQGRRLKPGERERQIYLEAAKLFAERGFEAGTPELADRLGVAQPLLYRYFRNKDDLIQRVYGRAHASETFWTSWEKIFDDGTGSFRDRLIEFYLSYTEVTWSYNFTRMALWANLSRPDLNKIYYIGVRARVFPRIIREMRVCFGSARKNTRPTKLEFELVHTLHGMIYYLAIRRWVHTQPFRDNVRSLIELKVDLFLHGAKSILAARKLPERRHGTTAAPLKRKKSVRANLKRN